LSLKVFDAQMAVQWVRRMEQLPQGKGPLPMRGPFLGKLPAYKRLQDNPLRMVQLPEGCSLRMTPDQKDQDDVRPYRLGSVPAEVYDDRAFDVSTSSSWRCPILQF
jgi:hypothetical protein